MTKRTKSILERLDERYTTEFRCSLNYTTPWELLVATMLSAQCTDERVNIVTKDLFVKYPDVSAVAHADVKEMEQRISQRLGFTKETEPEKIEYDLMKILPKDHWIVYNIQIITFGREICTARAPKCSECFLQDICKSKDKR